MTHPALIRNIRGRDHLEIFLVTGVSSLLLLRFYLKLSHYPQVGGGNLHIAHMLWGGLLMVIAILLMLAFLGLRVQRTAAFLGGAGFGIFIDELGKFLTKDNNYFFQPTIGIIYAIFVVLYIASTFISRDQTLHPSEYEMNALIQFEEVVRNDLDRSERLDLMRLLRHANQDSPVVQALRAALKDTPTIRTSPSALHRLRMYASRKYQQFWRQRASSRLVAGVFIAVAAILLLGVFATLASSFDSARDVFSGHALTIYSHKLIIGQLLATVVSSAFVVAGGIKLPSSRLAAFELFRKAMLVNILLTEFFIFSRIQFGAMPSFIVNLLLLIALHYAVHEERRSLEA